MSPHNDNNEKSELGLQSILYLGITDCTISLDLCETTDGTYGITISDT